MSFTSMRFKVVAIFVDDSRRKLMELITNGFVWKIIHEGKLFDMIISRDIVFHAGTSLLLYCDDRGSVKI